MSWYTIRFAVFYFNGASTIGEVAKIRANDTAEALYLFWRGAYAEYANVRQVTIQEITEESL